MERERPEYLEPIPRTRWEFPWMALWALLLAAMAASGIWLDISNGEAWNQRFAREPEPPAENAQRNISPQGSAERTVALAKIRAARERAETEARRGDASIRCIDGTAFRRIEGGWENIPGHPCP